MLSIPCASHRPREGCLPVVGGLLLTALTCTASADEGCRAGALSPDRLETVGLRGELGLASGRRALLAGLHWPETPAEADAAKAWLLQRAGQPLTVGALGGEDRWGRIQIDAVADPTREGEDPLDLAGGLVTEGLAQVDAGERDALCRLDLLALEAAPRSARQGIWATALRDARDGAALSALAGRFVVAEGRIVGIGERAARTYLDFVRLGESGLTVTVPKRTWRIMQERGLTAAALKGRLARVRGVVEIRRGPVIEIVSPDMIEVPKGEEAHPRRP